MPIEKLLAPLVPTDILCIGLNYREHADESNSAVPENPMLFIKSSNTLNNPSTRSRSRTRSSQIDYEGELAVVIGKAAKHVSRERALDYVLGYTCANDVSRPRLAAREDASAAASSPAARASTASARSARAIVTADEIPNPNALRLRTILNGQVMQDHTTADMIFDVPTLIESLSSTMTLRPAR